MLNRENVSVSRVTHNGFDGEIIPLIQQTVFNVLFLSRLCGAAARCGKDIFMFTLELFGLFLARLFNRSPLTYHTAVPPTPYHHTLTPHSHHTAARSK